MYCLDPCSWLATSFYNIILLFESPPQHKHTPLHLAAWKGYVTAVDLLIKSGADVNARSKVRTYI